jgi:transposase InsO family protein
MAKSTYYFEINKKDAVALKNAELLKEIQTIFEQNKRRYGVRRIHKELVNENPNPPAMLGRIV